MEPRITVRTLGVTDLERSLAFYRDGLGFATEGLVVQIGSPVHGPHGEGAIFRDLVSRVGDPPTSWPSTSMNASRARRIASERSNGTSRGGATRSAIGASWVVGASPTSAAHPTANRPIAGANALILSRILKSFPVRTRVSTRVSSPSYERQ